MMATACVRSGAWLIVAAIVLAAPAYADTATGATYVTTLPTGAEVWCDGTYVGRSPLLVDGLGEGRHALSILKPGWSAQESSVTVLRGTIAMSSTRLAPAKHQTPGADASSVGTLVLRDVPAGANVALDGKPLSAPASKSYALSAGTHDVTLTTAHGHSTRSVIVYPDLTTDVILHESIARRDRSGVVAPAEDYLPTNAFTVDGRRIVIRYGGHVVIARFGEAVYRIDGAPTDFDSAPEAIGGKLYLPLALLEKLSGDVSNAR